MTWCAYYLSIVCTTVYYVMYYSCSKVAVSSACDCLSLCGGVFIWLHTMTAVAGRQLASRGVQLGIVKREEEGGRVVLT